MAPATPPHGEPAPLGIESVAFATGTGRLVRRESAVLFDPSGQNPKLSSVFDDAADDNAAVAQVLHAVIEAELHAAPFAIVRWSGDLELLVFGDLELHTSCPSAPMISGAGSSTWVRHDVARGLAEASPSLQVWSGEPAEPGTNLRLGIAACDGFRLDLIADTRVTTPADPKPATIETEALEPPVAETEPVASEPITDPFEPDVEVPPGDPDPIPGDATPALLSFDEPETAPAPEPDEPPAIRVWTDEDQGDTSDDDTDADPFALPLDDEDDAGDAPNKAPAAASTKATAELLEFDAADVANLESSEPVAPVQAATATAEQAPPLALLIFDDRADLSVFGTSVLGRRPQADGDHAAIAIDHPEVSRTHAEIDTGESRGQVATIRDLGSRNGTWVQSPGGAGLRRLDADERALLLPGTIVHLGSVEVCFTWQPVDDQ